MLRTPAAPLQKHRWTGELCRLTLVSALVGAGLLGAPVLHDEWIDGRMEAAATQDLGGPAPLPWDVGDPDQLCPGDCPARADAALGVHLTLSAAQTTNPIRRRVLLRQAILRLEAALKARTSAGGWWSWLAYARMLAGAQQQVVISALAKSYDAAPFLAQEGPWRVRTCASAWADLAPAVRRRVIDEVVWLRDIDPDNARQIYGAFSDPAAAAALQAGLARPAALLVPHRRSGGPGGVGPAG